MEDARDDFTCTRRVRPAELPRSGETLAAGVSGCQHGSPWAACGGLAGVRECLSWPGGPCQGPRVDDTLAEPGAASKDPSAPPSGQLERAPSIEGARLVGASPLRSRIKGLVPHVLVLLVSFFVLSQALSVPRVLTADEVDTMRGGRQLVDLLTAPEHDPRLAWGDSLRGRLRAAFVPAPDNPRVAALPESAPRRAVVEAPVPRWLAALGVGVLPVPADATNLGRARVAASLALALALAVMTWSIRRRGPNRIAEAGFLVAAAFALPGFLDAGAAAGHAAAGFLTMALFLAATQRLLTTGRGSLLCGVALGLCLGVHPLHLALVAVVFIAWAIRRRPELETFGTEPGRVRLPSAPLGLFVIPIVAIAVLIAIWPSLWVDTGKRLGAWIADFGSLRSPPSEVAGLAWDQAAFRTSQAWTALFQWMVSTPMPILALWALGLARTIRRGRDGDWLPVVTLVTLLLTAGLDGGLFGARLSLMEALWAPTLFTATDGFGALVGWVRVRLGTARGTSIALATRHPWLVSLSPWALGLVFLAVPIIGAARGTPPAFVGHAGLEARFGLPVALMVHAEALAPGASVHVRPMPGWYRPALDVLRHDLESSLDWGDESAELLIAFGEPAPDLAPRLGEELGRLDGAGPSATLWRLKPPP